MTARSRVAMALVRVGIAVNVVWLLAALAVGCADVVWLFQTARSWQ